MTAANGRFFAAMWKWNSSLGAAVRGYLLITGIMAVMTAMVSAGQSPQEVSSKPGRPNFVWILSEDNSMHYLKLFDGHGAETPRIREMAADGLTFTRAFSCSPVCSVARTTLMTGMYAPGLGTQFHRRIRPVVQPEGWQLFPAWLRENGYYTTNNSKKDYNVVEKGHAWDESSRDAHWSRREDRSRPFFHMQSFGQSHESSLHFDDGAMKNNRTETDPGAVFVPPIHPGTPTFEYTYARYHDRIQIIDSLVGRMLDELRDAGELENTFVFYFGDHGGVLPGSKGYIYERGVHVPLVVRIPENFAHLADAEKGQSVDGFVSFVDFGPTLLRLAGIPEPGHLNGRAFLGRDVSMDEVRKRRTAFSYADRFDEKYDMVRAIRVGPYKYIRNFQGYYPDGLQNNYRYRMLAYSEWRDLFRQGSLNSVQSAFFQPRPPEMLFNVEEDPYETVNLAGESEWRAKLREMRRALNRQMLDLPDLSLFPESVLVAEAVSDPRGFVDSNRERFRTMLQTANLAIRPFDRVEERLRTALDSGDAVQRYWALNAACHFGKEAESLAEVAGGLTRADNPLVRLKAAEFLAIAAEVPPQETIHDILSTNDDPVVSLIVLNAVVNLRDHLGFEGWNINRDTVRAINSEVTRRIEYLQ